MVSTLHCSIKVGVVGRLFSEKQTSWHKLNTDPVIHAMALPVLNESEVSNKGVGSKLEMEP